MPRYSVATTKDKLSSLIDKALAGEEVIITRHGKPTVELRVVAPSSLGAQSNAAWMDWIAERRERRSSLGMNASDLIREMRDEGAH